MEEGRRKDDMSVTKEKILFETKDMVHNLNTLLYSLQTQVAVLISTQSELVKKIDGHMERTAMQYDRMDVRVTSMQTEMAAQAERMNRHRDEIDEMKRKSNLFDLINLAVTAIVGTIMYFVFGKSP